MDSPVAIEKSENFSKTQNKEILLEINNDDESDSEEYDTDLEENFKEEKDVHKTQEEVYLHMCKQLDIPPVNRFLRELCTDTVDLQHYGIGDNGVVAISTALARNITITKLNLCDNSISNAGSEALSRMLKDNCFITQLDVSENRLGTKGVERFCWNAIHLRGVAAIAKGLKANRFLKNLNISRNSILNEGATEIGEALAINKSLRVLDISNCGFNEIGAEAISDGLSNNTTLHTLKIGRNLFHDYGVHKLLKEIRKNTSSALKQLYMDDTTLDHACVRELEMLTQERPGFTCLWGTVVKGGGLVTTVPASLRRTPKTPLVVQKFLSFVSSRGWRLIDLFRIITRNDFSALRMTLDRERFVQGLLKLEFRLKKVQLDELFDILDVDEVVRFQEFVAMKQQTR
ncbi:hypothetical protein OS493_037567 [Desmophyllum pertusum]|uniref:Uncharacterized protein n=1 Tax=Desmophyllum pertusum TaxID=174260 RepID=A0A9W9YUB2_9CNID|nr:hypothetical protein OS493_037567 [Desmophyllum pertusum]